MFHVCYCILTNCFSVVLLLKRTNAPYSHDRCLMVITQLLSVRGMLHNLKFHVYHCSFKKHFRLGMHIMGALVKCSSLDEIGTIVFHVTVLCTVAYEKHASKSFEIIKENPETMCGTEVQQILDWWITSFIFHPNLILVMILFFTSLQIVCLDEIDNYVEIVLISCMP